MIPKTCGSYVISTENGKLTKQFSLKKRFLMAYAKSEETPGAVQTEQCFNDETRENIITGVETTATHTQIPGLKQSNNSPSNQADLNSSPLSSDLIHDNLLHSYPSIEYEVSLRLIACFAFCCCFYGDIKIVNGLLKAACVSVMYTMHRHISYNRMLRTFVLNNTASSFHCMNCTELVRRR